MPRFVEQRWEGNPGAVGGRAARRSFTYQAFVPDPIATLDPQVSFRAATAAFEAERAVRELNDRATARGRDAIGPLLLRSESIASSRIEGYHVSTPDLARALVDPGAARGSARTVAANVSAMEEAIARADDPAPITVEDICGIHATLMAREPDTAPGQVRQVQNWLGGRLDSPMDAAFIPAPPGEVRPLLDDLLRFLERDDIPPLARAAIAHAQFETIHPFSDGNGRLGRCLIHIVLRRTGVAARFVPPVSIVMAARPTSYVGGLVDFREGRISEWAGSFSEACERGRPCGRPRRRRRGAAARLDRARRPTTSGLGRRDAHRPPASAADRLGPDRPRGDRHEPASGARRAQGPHRGRRPPPDQRGHLRSPVRGRRPVRPCHGLRGTDRRTRAGGGARRQLTCRSTSGALVPRIDDVCDRGDARKARADQRAHGGRLRRPLF